MATSASEAARAAIAARNARLRRAAARGDDFASFLGVGS